MIKLTLLLLLLLTVDCRHLKHNENALLKKIGDAKLVDVLGMFLPLELTIASEVLPHVAPQTGGLKGIGESIIGKASDLAISFQQKFDKVVKSYNAKQ